MEYDYAILKEQEEKINPKIAKEIKALFKPYEDSIKETEGYHKLEVLAMQADSLNLKVNDDIMRFFQIYSKIIVSRICRKIRLYYQEDMSPDFSLRDVEAIMKENGIDNDFRTVIISAMNSSMLINLNLEDCYTAFKNSNKLQSIKLNCDNRLKNRLKLTNAKSAIIVIYGTYKTRLNDLKQYWDIITSKLQDETPIGFSYDVKHKLKKEKMYALIGY